MAYQISTTDATKLLSDVFSLAEDDERDDQPINLPKKAREDMQFLSGMEWANYGTVWHVDHILPQSFFKIDADDPANCLEFQACWALSNLRPLWKRDNLVKNARRSHLL